MIAVFVLVCLSLATAAPQYGLRLGYLSDPDDSFYHHGHGQLSENIFGDNIFDTRRFWQELTEEMQRFDQMVNEFYKRFPITSTSTAGIEGNEYVITMTLNGFQEKDIKIKAKEGVLMVQAVHNSEEGDQRTHIDLRTLPSYVNINGTWTYDRGTLRIVFPLNKKPEDVTETAVTETHTEGTEDRSREEMDVTHKEENENEDADVGIQRGDEKENEIPRENTIEATTYAVDLNNEIDFVPVKY